MGAVTNIPLTAFRLSYHYSLFLVQTDSSIPVDLMGARISCLSARNDTDDKSLVHPESKHQHDTSHEQHVEKDHIHDSRNYDSRNLPYPFPNDLTEIDR
jgi:hypothetical protein